MPTELLDLARAVLSIVIIDLVLSGDNAVVIGMAAHRLPSAQRRRAILLGAGGAIVLRVFFTILAALLLEIPLLQGIGGLVLIWIAFKLLRQDESEHTVREGASLLDAAKTIVLADVVMSLDNILAVGGASHGQIELLLFGLMLSMSLILFGSNLIAILMGRLPWLVYIGAAILVYTATEMVFSDPILDRFLPDATAVQWAIVALLIVATLGLAYWRNERHGADTTAL
ncbi:MAG: TerC family protein [Thermomicrobiales bacterium]|nr:TerC family protein [Thermomicrobiales bacterium]